MDKVVQQNVTHADGSASASRDAAAQGSWRSGGKLYPDCTLRKTVLSSYLFWESVFETRKNHLRYHKRKTTFSLPERPACYGSEVMREEWGNRSPLHPGALCAHFAHEYPASPEGGKGGPSTLERSPLTTADFILRLSLWLESFAPGKISSSRLFFGKM